MSSRIVELFPGLTVGRFRITSDATSEYNCVAWAVGEDDRWWEPSWPYAFWPSSAEHKASLKAYMQALQSVGFQYCADGKPEAGMEKVAIYASKGVPRHVARQLSNGKWTSKLGELEDIEHELHALEGGEYGEVVAFMRRPRQ